MDFDPYQILLFLTNLVEKLFLVIFLGSICDLLNQIVNILGLLSCVNKSFKLDFFPETYSILQYIFCLLQKLARYNLSILLLVSRSLNMIFLFTFGLPRKFRQACDYLGYGIVISYSSCLLFSYSGFYFMSDLELDFINIYFYDELQIIYQQQHHLFIGHYILIVFIIKNRNKIKIQQEKIRKLIKEELDKKKEKNMFNIKIYGLLQQVLQQYNIMKQKQKLIVTLWRAHIDSASNYESVFCRLTYAKHQQDSKHISAAKSLTWKQTFVFSLSKESLPLKLDFINMHQIKQIHFAKQQVLDGLTIGKSQVSIDLDNSNRGTVPAKLHINNEDGKHVGTVFLEYQIIKTQVTYIVQKLIDYEFLMKIKSFKLSFLRSLPTVPSFYLKFIFGQRSQKEDFSFQQSEGTFIYNYPVKFFIKYESEMTIEIQIKDMYKKDYRNLNTSLDTQSVYSNNMSAQSTKKGGKKNLIDIQSIDKLTTVLDLGFKKDGIFNKKLPISMMIKNSNIEVGSLQFQVQIQFRTKKQKQEFQIQKKREMELKNIVEVKKKKQKKFQPPKSGEIIVNSIIGRLQLFNQDIIANKDASIELKLGKVTQQSVVLQNPGKQIIWLDTFTFKRNWEEVIKFIVYVHSGDLKMPKFYTNVNLRDLFELGRYMGKKLQLKDQVNNYCGYLVVDIIFKEEQQKPKEVAVKKMPDIPPQQKQKLAVELKKQKIIQRMKLRQQNKKKRQSDLESGIPTFSQKQLFLPPLRSSRNLRQQRTLSPRNSQNISVNVYNHGGAQIFSRSPRFDGVKKHHDADSFIFKAQSEFQAKKNRGASIGYGQKYDFTKQYQHAPGVGRYQIPSVWDKYK